MLILRGQCVLLAGPAARPPPPSMHALPLCSFARGYCGMKRAGLHQYQLI